jgi:hypothetical protein
VSLLQAIKAKWFAFILTGIAKETYSMPTPTKSEGEVEGTMYVTLKAHLRRLDAEEQQKPPALRRYIPKMGDIARRAGIHPVTLSGIANNKIKLLNLDVGGRIIAAVQSYGFPMEVTDLLAFQGETKAPIDA